MTADYVAFHAAERPEAVAIVSDGRSITYAELDRDIRKFAAAIRGLGATAGGSIAIGCDDFHLHLLLLLACERLGVASASLASREGPSVLRMLALMDLVLSERAFPPGAVRRYREITPEWVQSVLDAAVPDDAGLPARTAEDIVRIGRTSGTTGGAKQIAFNRRQRDARVSGQIWGAGLTRNSRCLIAMPLGVNSCYVLALGGLRSGAALVSDKSPDIPDLIAAHGVTHLMLLPLHLRTTLERLPAGYRKPSDLTIITIGAPLSDALRERAMAQLAIRVCDLYGTQEVGNIAWRTSGGTGGIATTWPNVQVEVVDDADLPVPLGRVGRLRVRAGYMVEGYLDEPEATRRMFRHGWFYPGDVAVLHSPIRLQLLGRGDDLLNIGGTKVPPSAIEELLARAVDARDVGVCTIRNADEIEEIWIGVTDCQISDMDLLQRIKEVLGPVHIGAFRVMRLAQLPRNASGKIRRDEFRAMMVELAKRSHPVASG
jgi:2,3-dihydroxybenzoate-AMP ligase